MNHKIRYSIILAAALALAACKEKPSTSVADAHIDPSVVEAGEAFEGKLKVAPLGTAAVSESLRVAGRVDFNEQKVIRIGATVTGRVMELHASLGQAVKVGETLAVLNSTELSDAQLAYLKARSQAEQASRAVERARQLYAADVIGRAELQRRESELHVAEAEQRAGADQLRVLGIGARAIERLGREGHINSVTPVVSSMSGVVVERKVAQGQVVQPADAMFVVADLSRVWVVAEVPEQQAGLVQVGQTVEIEIPALENRVSGKLVFISDTLSPETRTVTVRTELDNSSRLLKPAMLATMLIQSRPVAQTVVPEQAVVRENDIDHLFLESSEKVFRLVPVKLGPPSGGVRPVFSGLKAGDRVVVEGAFHLNNERKRKELE